MKNCGQKMLVLAAAAGMAAVAVFGFLLFDALVLEPNWITVERVIIHNPALARELGGMTIAQISDLHLKGGLGFKEEELIRKLNRLKPDIIVVTGDLVEDESAAPIVAEFFSRLKPKLWCYGILGNSDRRYLTGNGFKKKWRDAGLSLIGGSCRAMGGEGEGVFWLGGIDFPGYEAPGMESEIDRIMRNVPPRGAGDLSFV